MTLLRGDDHSRASLIVAPLQDVALEEVIGTLRANDVLFIDSSHVSRVGSDVNRLIFAVLPELPKGVFVHFHDVFYPFEYPQEWVYEGRGWNEAYILRAYLQANPGYKIRLGTTSAEVGSKSRWKHLARADLNGRRGNASEAREIAMCVVSVALVPTTRPWEHPASRIE